MNVLTIGAWKKPYIAVVGRDTSLHYEADVFTNSIEKWVYYNTLQLKSYSKKKKTYKSLYYKYNIICVIVIIVWIKFMIFVYNQQRGGCY